MCLTIPAKVLYIEESNSPVLRITVESAGKIKPLNAIMLDDLKVGDWVLYTSGNAVRKVSEEDAGEILELLEPKSHIDTGKLDVGFIQSVENLSGSTYRKEDIIRLLKADDTVEMEALFAEANTIRQANLKDFFCIHGIVEFSSHCANDCHYCGLRKSNTFATRYRMEEEEIIDAVVDAVENRGYKLIVLQSGDDFSYTDDMLEDIIRKIKKLCKVFIFMSIGERSFECYKRLKSAGASGALFRFETSNREIYKTIHPGQSFTKRIEIIRELKKLGYYLASGFLVGLPGQRVEDIADDILMMKELGVQMVSVGPFVPSDGTPLSEQPAGDAAMVLKVTAISRLLMPKAKIPVTTALETIENEEGRKLGLSSGANSLMFNLTPEKYREDYSIYPNKYHGNEAMWEKYGLYNEALSYKMLEKKMLEVFEIND